MKKFLAGLFLSYLRFLSQVQLRKINPKVIGIGGSSGKTSVSSLVALVLSQNHKVRSNAGKNSETGIPLSILNLDPGKYDLLSWIRVAILAPIKVLTDFEKYEFLVMEMGIDGPKPPKNMGYLLTIVKPNVAILTNIALEHTVYFEDMVKDVPPEKKAEKILELIRDDQMLLVKKLTPIDIAVINQDDSNIKIGAQEINAKVLSISSEDKNSSFFIKDWRPSIEGTSLKFSNEGRDYSMEIKRPLPNIYGYSILLSIAAASAVGVGVSESIKTIEDKFDLPGGRLSVFEGVSDSIIIDSTYNNNLEAISGILDVMPQISGERRRVGVIGDMREQGNQSKDLHEKLAQKIIQDLNYAILVGPLMAEFVAPILKKNNFSFESFENFSKASGPILKSIKKKDLILVKGSQNTLFLERVIELLLKDKRNISKLARRGEFWDHVRSVTP